MVGHLGRAGPAGEAGSRREPVGPPAGGCVSSRARAASRLSGRQSTHGSRPLFLASRHDAAVAKDAVVRWQRRDRVRLSPVVGGRVSVVGPVYRSVGRLLRQWALNRRRRCQRHGPMPDDQQRYLHGTIAETSRKVTFGQSRAQADLIRLILPYMPETQGRFALPNLGNSYIKRLQQLK